MSIITAVPEPNIWNEICKEYELKGKLVIDDDDHLSTSPIEVDYNADKHTPVFFGTMHKRIEIDGSVEQDFDSALSHPACVGYAFVDKPPDLPLPEPPMPPDQRKCSPQEYLENYVFPILLPALEELLRQAKKEKCFERKRTKFNAGDFLTEYLYRCNPAQCDREAVFLEDIPFVKEWWKEHPRPPLPKSLLWSEPEAILIIQSFWRGYKIRQEESVQELRQWQKEWREENRNIQETVNEFWADKIPDEKETEPSNEDAIVNVKENQLVISSEQNNNHDQSLTTNDVTSENAPIATFREIIKLCNVSDKTG